jgi:drug/metabolite transporter (DMT)-like permease
MRQHRLLPLFCLAAAGLLWGATVPLTKLVLPWVGPAWLTVARFGFAAVLLVWPARQHLRAALTPGVVVAGMAGYGLIILLQNAGVARTSVTHAALLAGVIPVLVALLTTALGRGRIRPLGWLGFALAFAGVGGITLAGGGAASAVGDVLVIASVLASTAFVVVQPGLLAGRDPVAVTVVQFGAAALATAPLAVAFEAPPAGPPAAGVGLALLGLVIGGTLAPFTLFAFAQARVSAEVAGGFLNLEPLVGAAAGALAFGDPAGPAQAGAGIAILAGIALTTLPLFGRAETDLRPPTPGGVRGGARMAC